MQWLLTQEFLKLAAKAALDSLTSNVTSALKGGG